jgi:membrane fusion protein (multidrug efflux system)
MQAISEIQNTSVRNHPLVEKAKEEVRKAWVHLERCTLRAPASGIIALRQVQVGQSVNPSMPLLAIVPINQMWVDANFKEVDLANIRIGQEATVTADTYGRRVIYNGTVIGIGGGSGAVFSPLPPQNATGNWIKIVQRIPVRISLNSDQLRKYPLRLGLSMKARVDIRDSEGLRIPDVQKKDSLYETDVFQKQVEGAEAVIEEVLKQNSSFDFLLAHEITQLVQ